MRVFDVGEVVNKRVLEVKEFDVEVTMKIGKRDLLFFSYIYIEGGENEVIIIIMFKNTFLPHHVIYKL